MSSVIQKLQDTEEESAAAARQGYRDVVRRLAADGELELSNVQAILADAEKTVDDLRNDVRHRQQRNEKQKVLSDYENALSEKPGLQQRILDAKSELNRAEQKYRQVAGPLQHRLAEINEMSLAASQAKRELRQGCDDAELLAEQRSLQFSLQQIHDKIRAQQELVERIRILLRDERERYRPHGRDEWLSDADKGGNPSEVQRLQGRLATEEPKLVELRVEQADLLEQEKRLHEAMTRS